MKDIPKAYNPADHEDAIYKQWEASGFFNPDICVREGVTEADADPFSIVLPPPNVTGTLHMGHAAMLAIEDVMVRHARMQGKRALWIPGTDHASIATESKVEKILFDSEKKTRHDLGREDFLKRVDVFAKESHDTIVNQARKMGASLDWSREAFTLDEPRNLAVRTTFKRMYDDGLIYRGARMVNWDPKMQSNVSDDEIEWKEEQIPFYYLQYGPFVIGTARPETKFGDKYVVMHPADERYTQYKHGEQFELEWINGPVTATVIKDEAIDVNFGTGVMTITPWHDATDYEIAKRHDLDMQQVIGLDGKLLPIAGEFVGMNIKEARPLIAQKLNEKGLLVRVEDNYTHRVATNYRGGGMIEPQIREQWFIDVNKPFTMGHSHIEGIEEGQEVSLKEAMLQVVRNAQIKIIPERFDKTYFHWVENLRDWCISRQIWYGHRIPVWYRGDEIYCDVEPPADADQWTQDPDTLDTWFSSGLWTFSTLGWPYTRVIFVRHGEAEHNVRDLMDDGTDGTQYALTEKGRAQIEKLAGELQREGVVQIIASPMLRTQQTAQILSDTLGASVVYDERIREVGMGRIEGKSAAELMEARGELQDWLVQTRSGVESYLHLKERLHSFMKETLQKYRGKTIIIVSHGDPIAVLKSYGDAKATEGVGGCPPTGSHIIRSFSPEGVQGGDLRTYHPTSVLETGYDIIFFWVARMILMSTYIMGEVPFKHVYLHGLVRDEQGRKMSKTLGNIIDPLDMIAKYGTDATRLSLLLGSAPGNDTKLSEEKVAGFRNFTNKLWNIGRYILTQDGVDEPFAPATLVEKWIVTRLDETVREVTADIEKYAFSAAGEKLRDFTWNELADWYIEVSKVQPNPNLLRSILGVLLHLWHPFMPFSTEVLWRMMRPQQDLSFLMVSRWPKPDEIPSDISAKEQFALVQNMIVSVRALRQEYRVAPATFVTLQIATEDTELHALLEGEAEIIKRLARVSEIIFGADKPEGAASIAFSGMTAYVPLAGIVDVTQERARLQKEHDEFAKYVASLSSKLENQDFVAHAPEAVVEKEREKLGEAKKKLEGLEKQIGALV